MSKNLVIVESPAKAKTIHKFLGKDYEVHACMGHIRDLPKTKLGIDVDNNFTPKYQTIPQKTSLVEELKKYADKAKHVFLATDLDREGEAIAWHLSEALKLPPDKVARVIFNEITEPAIKAAFASPRQIEMNKVYAQQARRVLDRIVGYQLSPLLWQKIARGLSAGRVQSVAVELIVEKEKEIQKFKSEEYWKITARLSSREHTQQIFEAELKKISGKKASVPDGTKAKELVERLKPQPFVVAEVAGKEKSEAPPPPFTTSLLQQQASIRLRFRTQHTMSVAQQLYEGLELGSAGPIGLITYMRTDSVRVSNEAISEVRDFIPKQFSPAYLPDAPVVHKSKKTAQEAHEAIRPSSVWRKPDDIKQYLSSDQYRLYKLIWERFVASQMKPARYFLTTVTITCDDCLFESKGKQVLFPGYTVLMGGLTPEEGKEEENSGVLPPLKEKEVLSLHELKPSQHFTQPPPRFTEATLVKTLEAKGIGRPSTYAPIISTIQQRGYVKLEDRKFHASELGIKVSDQLAQYFPRIMDAGFTADMETKLDDIEDSQVDWVSVLREFYGLFSQDLKVAYDEMENLKKNPEVSAYECPQCKSSLIYRYNKQGKFLGCSGFPQCKYAAPVDAEGKPVFPITTEYKCEKCGRNLVVKQSKSGKFLGCPGYPECAFTLPMGEDGKPVVPEKTDEKCPLCGAFMLKKQGPRGLFLACSRYPECKSTKPLFGGKKEHPLRQWLKAVCSKCGKAMTLRSGPRGVFLGCTGYPECKNIQKFTAEAVSLPSDFVVPTCEVCGGPTVLKPGRKDVFWGCPRYPECKFSKPFVVEEAGKVKKSGEAEPPAEVQPEEM
jgi:DNA topoisomerase-1